MIQKMHGVYYTPQEQANAIVKYIYQSLPVNISIKKILEPSCGAGNFLYPLSVISKDSHNAILSVVDIDENQLKSVKLKFKDKFTQLNSYHCDFLDFGNFNSDKYDLIIGNPPYVKRNFLKPSQKEKCRALNKAAYGHNYSVYNLWLAFLISCSQRLTPKGILAFILPRELLHVNFSNDLRPFLSSIFKRIELISFTNSPFDDIEQDTIIFIGFCSHSIKGTFYAEMQDESYLEKNKFEFKTSVTDLLSIPKLSFLAQSNNHLNLIKKIDVNLLSIGNLCSSSPGLVTGANSFFIVNEEILHKYNLHDYAKKIIQKSEYIGNNIEFTDEDWQELNSQGKNTYLLYFEHDFNDHIPENVNKYLNLRKEELLERFKISKRTPWYKVPKVSASECIFFKRSHFFPKLVYNRSSAYVTDIGYKIYVNEPYNLISFIFSFYNSYTLCMAELEGRSYAGGVLELTPNEFRNLRIPYTKITLRQFAEFIRLIKTGNIETVLNYTDRITLEKNYNVSTEDISNLREIRRHFVNSRHKK
jgi:adenine-specific DNA-methyltransferase